MGPPSGLLGLVPVCFGWVSNQENTSAQPLTLATEEQIIDTSPPPPQRDVFAAEHDTCVPLLGSVCLTQMNGSQPSQE